MRRLVLVLLLLSTGAAARAQAPPANGVRYVYLVRHAIYDRDSTVTDDRVGNGLNALGHEQAKLVGARFAALPVKVDRLVSSDFLRAAQTADDMGRLLKLEPERDSLLHECTPPAERKDYTANLAADELALCTSNLAAAFAKYLTPSPDRDRRDVLVAHGNVIRWFVAKAIGPDPQVWSRLDIGNASITVLAVRPNGEVRLVSLSDVGHLPPAKQTWTGRGAGYAAPAAR